ncbi:phosphate transport system protein [Plasticicumulans lactativorans]|uniref:Phosphate-specific transport system accessory protein PhoU n=1 Tax=Plasticicumulans lactativorans TaxID=1133106 RepID=A0A4R2LDK8_9GAMM|nr:phosphate signaling complex protein PhoU [Plasticicumulans lactativorans]TCO83702.1 phosphate transport system protein [Plasticicumulans lactativorans]
MTVSTEGHTVKRYDQQLGNLRSLVLEMGGLVEDQITRAVQALQDEDLVAAREVVARDHVVNGFDVRADEEVVNLLALRQPVGSDLRLILSMAKTVTDLERIGDEAEKIARMTARMYDGTNIPHAKLLRDVASMAKLAVAMLHGALDALARMDVATALAIAKGDDELDGEFQSSLRRLATFMMEDPRTIGHAIDAIFIIKALERIGDHSKNIAEYVVYLVKGKDVRHVKKEQLTMDDLDS